MTLKKQIFKILKPWKQIDAMIMETAFFCNYFLKFPTNKKGGETKQLPKLQSNFFFW